MSAAHTQGPWTAKPTGPWDGWDGWSVESATGAVVCDAHGSQLDGSREANACLIAAAPELLEALKSAYVELHYCSQQLVASGWTEGSTVRDALANARTVLAKTTGATS